ncbi:MAG: DUF4442 domain-containing protein [Bacteroidetes bacterium]|nr:DUF4442 domain-containing protein [Bacteroidota bacterium]
MTKLNTLIQKAEHSRFYLWLLNTALLRYVPFNRPHKLKIQQISPNGITIAAKSIKNNLNHIQGVHACLLATLCEYVSGFSLLINLSPTKYRVILKNIGMTYHYQAKTDVWTHFNIPSEEIQGILGELQNKDAIFKEFSVQVFDAQKNHICTGLINWQIKSWEHVKTKLN